MVKIDLIIDVNLRFMNLRFTFIQLIIVKPSRMVCLFLVILNDISE